jgi:hypothetical protein
VRRARARHIRRSTSHFALRSAVPTGEFVTTWEYLTTPLMIHNTAAILNNWGKQGWELVQVVPNADGGPAGGGEQNAGLAHAAQAAKQFEGEGAQ